MKIKEIKIIVELNYVSDYTILTKYVIRDAGSLDRIDRNMSGQLFPTKQTTVVHDNRQHNNTKRNILMVVKV